MTLSNAFRVERKVHCFAGKDRTGIAAMLLLKLLGVDDEAVMEDYIITNERRKAANDELLDKVRESGVPEEKVAALRTFIMVREEYLVAAREVMDEEYGSFEGYVEKGLRLDAKCLEQFKENYLE